MNVGGPALQVSTLMENLDNSNFQQKLIYGSCEKNERSYVYDKNIHFESKRLKFLKRGINPFFDLISLFQIIYEIILFKPDIVHSHTSKVGFMCRIISYLFPKLIFIHTYHGHLIGGYAKNRFEKLYIKSEKFFAKKNDILITVGEKIKKDLLDQGIGREEKFSVIYPGFDFLITNNKQNARSLLNIPEDQYVVGFISRLVKIKRIDRLCEIIEQIMSITHKISFVIIGDGDQMHLLKKLKSKYENNLILLGWNRCVNKFLPGFDSVLLVSDNEGSPLSIIQAGFAGIPVVTTNVGSVNELVIDAVSGFVVEPNTLDLVEKIMFLYSNPNNSKLMGRKAYEYSKSKFSKNSFINSHSEIYIKCIELKSKI